MREDYRAYGGYLVGWNDAKHFQPKGGEPILIHLEAWKPDEWGVGCLNDGEILLHDGEAVDYSMVDYWMHIPPISGNSKRDMRPYIVGSDYSAEEKLWRENNQKRWQELEKQKYGMISEEIQKDVIERIRKIVKEHKEIYGE